MSLFTEASLVRLCLLLFIFVAGPSLCSAEAGRTNSLEELVNSARTLRELAQSDPYRPVYHFVAPEGHASAFDPNGALYWKGKYHLGFIYQKLIGGNKQNAWGHAVSADLLHWTIYPDMLDVSEGDIEDEIYSGGAFISKENVPHIIYYGKGASAILIARAMDDDLKVWKKIPANPVLMSLTPEEDRSAHTVCCVPPEGKYSVFDPDAWYDEKAGYYYQITGGMKPGLFKSADLSNWKYLGSVVGANDSARYPFEDLSCPDFFSIGRKSMLLFISHPFGAQYYIGSFANDRFTPERHGRMNWPGGTFFAPEQLQDDKGRNIIWGWIIEPRTGMRNWRVVPNSGTAAPPDYGWSGIMSLPRVVSLDDSGELQINPPEEIELIRLNEVREKGVVLPANEELTLSASGKSIELKIAIAGGARSPFGIKVFASPDGQEETIIRYEPEQQQLVIDFVRSSIDAPVNIEVIGTQTKDYLFHPVLERVSQQRAPLKLKRGESLELDVFLDRSVIEVFANGRQAMTQVVYPRLESSTRVKVFSGNESITVKGAQSWTMAETNPY